MSLLEDMTSWGLGEVQGVRTDNGRQFSAIRVCRERYASHQSLVSDYIEQC